MAIEFQPFLNPSNMLNTITLLIFAPFRPRHPTPDPSDPARRGPARRHRRGLWMSRGARPQRLGGDGEGAGKDGSDVSERHEVGDFWGESVESSKLSLETRGV